jgi:hypothetical protein
MNVIREKRKLNFSSKRITPEIIRNIASIIDQESSQYTRQEKKQSFISFSVDATDNSSYESQSRQIFNENMIIDKKVLHRINMRFNTVDFSKNIEVQLLHFEKDENKENYILVSGEDSNWVNGCIARLSEAIELAQIQPNVSIKLRILWWVLVISLNVLIYRLGAPILKLDPPGNSGIITFFKTIYLFVPILSTMAFYNRAEDFINKLYPCIELQTGPQYLQIEKIKRAKLINFFLIIVVPILLAVLYDVLKLLVSVH